MSTVRIRWDKGRGKSARVKPNVPKRLRDELAKLSDGASFLLGKELWTKERALAALDDLIAKDEAVARTRWALREARRNLSRQLSENGKFIGEVERVLREQLGADHPIVKALGAPSRKTTGKPKSK